MRPQTLYRGEAKKTKASKMDKAYNNLMKERARAELKKKKETAAQGA